MNPAVSYTCSTLPIYKPLESIVSKKSRSKSSRKHKSNRSGLSHGILLPEIRVTHSAAALIEGMEHLDRSLFGIVLPEMLTSEEVTSCIQIYGCYQSVLTCVDTQFLVQYVGRPVLVDGHMAKPVFVLDTYDGHRPGDMQPPSWLGSFEPLLRTTPLDGFRSEA